KDSHRAISPLKKADDAVEVDKTNMSIDEVVDDILAKINAKMAN
ncbi:(d)CMP kinase, partial [Lactobacillus jensenii]